MAGVFGGAGRGKQKVVYGGRCLIQHLGDAASAMPFALWQSAAMAGMFGAVGRTEGLATDGGRCLVLRLGDAPSATLLPNGKTLRWSECWRGWADGRTLT